MYSRLTFYTPMLLFLMIGGVAVDRFSRVKLMPGADINRGSSMILVTALAHPKIYKFD